MILLQEGAVLISQDSRVEISTRKLDSRIVKISGRNFRVALESNVLEKVGLEYLKVMERGKDRSRKEVPVSRSHHRDKRAGKCVCSTHV